MKASPDFLSWCDDDHNLNQIRLEDGDLMENSEGVAGCDRIDQTSKEH